MGDFNIKANEHNHGQLSFLVIMGDSLGWSIEY